MGRREVDDGWPEHQRDRGDDGKPGQSKRTDIRKVDQRRQRDEDKREDDDREVIEEVDHVLVVRQVNVSENKAGHCGSGDTRLARNRFSTSVGDDDPGKNDQPGVKRRCRRSGLSMLEEEPDRSRNERTDCEPDSQPSRKLTDERGRCSSPRDEDFEDDDNQNRRGDIVDYTFTLENAGNVIAHGHDLQDRSDHRRPGRNQQCAD